MTDTSPADMANREESQAQHEAAGMALFRLGRLFGRQPQANPAQQNPAPGVELSRILVVQAVEALAGEHGDELPIGAVAAWLDIDPSTASRLVAETIRDGYLARTAAPGDARRARLALTAPGRILAKDARRYQRIVFEEVTRDWSPEERREFARLFVRFAAGVRQLRTSR